MTPYRRHRLKDCRNYKEMAVKKNGKKGLIIGCKKTGCLVVSNMGNPRCKLQTGNVKTKQ